MKVIYLGAGGFWTPEAIYKKVNGVEEVVPGFMGGTIANPSYEAVATGTTGHVEVVKITYDENLVSTENILRIFYAMHDVSAQQHPSVGVGSQYRSVIFYTEELQGEASDPANGDDVGVIERVTGEVQYTLPEDMPVSTQMMSATTFYPAEEYHYNFYEKNPDATYAVTIIAPALEKMRNQFPSLFIS
jgi:methionine-S-sulfoxide reductase